MMVVVLKMTVLVNAVVQPLKMNVEYVAVMVLPMALVIVMVM